MTLLSSRHRAIAAIGVMALAAACTHHARPEPPSGSPPPSPPATAASGVPVAPPVATPGLTARQRMDRAIALLADGRPDAARPELVALLDARPGDRRATLLLRTIDTDPRQLYGGDSFALEVRPGQTLFTLARQYLGDALDFYGLARFNGIAVPSSVAPGQTIQIPGHPRSPIRAERARRPSAARPDEAVAPSGSTATHAASDSRKAQALRARGLEQMSAGSIDRATALLSQAALLAPDNPKIAADLARARRIQATVHGQ